MPNLSPHFKTDAPYGLYIHIPFCHVKCKFCDFAAYPGMLREIPRYLKALNTEMRGFEGTGLDTIFVGGGTPTTLEAKQLGDLFSEVRKIFSVSKRCEISVECNPESTTPEKLEAMKKAGVNRLSFGLQATQDHLLKRLGRQHDFDQFKSVFLQSRKMGFKNLNVDLMYGLPEQTLNDWQETLEQVLELEPEHLSAYALSVEEKTQFRHSGVRADDEIESEMYLIADGKLEPAGFVHYEISNFAKPGCECRHNLRYWKNLDCLGVGVSAASYMNGVRRKNTDRVGAYLDAIERGQSPVIEDVVLSDAERAGENLMLGLRLKEGVPVKSREAEIYADVLNKYRDLGFLAFDADRIRPTLRGWLLSNQMFQELLEPATIDQ